MVENPSFLRAFRSLRRLLYRRTEGSQVGMGVAIMCRTDEESPRTLWIE